MSGQQHRRARLALLAVTALWGSTFVVIHSSLELVSPLVLVGSRFAVAALALAALRPAAVRELPRVWRASLRLTLPLFAGFVLQTFGLQHTTPARSAFLTSLSVLMVPLIELLRTRRRLPARMLLAAGLAAVGVWILFRPVGLEWNRGDTLTLLCALAFADYVVELGRQGGRHRPSALVLGQFVVMAPVALLLAPWLEQPRFVVGLEAVGGVVYLGLMATVICFLLMTWAQARMPATEAGIIYTAEPVFAGAFSVLLGREPLSAALALGGLLIVSAMAIGESASEAPPAPPAGID